MRISFDLDEVLFVDPNRYAIEKPPGGLAGILFKEKLRKGTVDLSTNYDPILVAKMQSGA